MSGFASRWVVAHEINVAAADLDADGVATDAAVERWIRAACAAYLERCTALRVLQEQGGFEFSVGHRREHRPHEGARRDRRARERGRATEFLPDSFRIAVRVRSAEGVLDTTCAVRLEDAAGVAVPLTDEIRDELIALEHDAQHVN